MDLEADLNWVDIGSVFDFPSGTAKEVLVGEHVLAIFHDGESFFALDGLCAHQGGPIAKGELSQTDAGKTCVTCPWHGWQYELDSGIQTINRQPLQRTFPVRQNELRLEVQV
jgi:nitrite reductase/ring-hydroxylating ferredoxin subunit